MLIYRLVASYRLPIIIGLGIFLQWVKDRLNTDSDFSCLIQVVDGLPVVTPQREKLTETIKLFKRLMDLGRWWKCVCWDVEYWVSRLMNFNGFLNIPKWTPRVALSCNIHLMDILVLILLILNIINCCVNSFFLHPLSIFLCCECHPWRSRYRMGIEVALWRLLETHICCTFHIPSLCAIAKYVVACLLMISSHILHFYYAKGESVNQSSPRFIFNAIKARDRHLPKASRHDKTQDGTTDKNWECSSLCSHAIVRMCVCLFRGQE